MSSRADADLTLETLLASVQLNTDSVKTFDCVSRFRFVHDVVGLSQVPKVLDVLL
jgi:ABC-type enterochelin transport system substrate-binding protein